MQLGLRLARFAATSRAAIVSFTSVCVAVILVASKEHGEV
jgi:hypothetical protein